MKIPPKIFIGNKNFRKSAFLNWRMDSGEILNVFNMAEGYFQSAIILTEKALEDNRDKKADIIIFPILTCFNHGIELYLKGLTYIFNKILDNTISVDGTHNLKQLFNTLRARIKDLEGEKVSNQFKKNFIELSDYIDELTGKINASPKNDKMDFSRYPYTKKEENHFYAEGFSNVEVDLENLLELMKLLHKKFDSFSTNLYYDKIEK